MMTAAGGGGLNVEDVFSNYVYDGSGSTRTITNGIDLDGEGGLVWMKIRSATASNQLYDTERGATKWLLSDDTSAQITYTSGLTAFNSDGFTLSSGVGVNGSTQNYGSWTFRKAPKFFDVVTYTGDGTGATFRNIPHNLGCTPGLIILKRLDSATNWEVSALNSAGTYERLRLNLTNATSGTQTGHTSTTFHAITSSMNVSGGSYVAHLFAHNDGDGGFGLTGDQDIIKCGSYTGTGAAGNSIDLGFEPQFVLYKNASSTTDWHIIDNMRGHASTQYPTVSNTRGLSPNKSDAEFSANYSFPTPTGFEISSSNSRINASGDTYIYMAIRRGPMAVPESATDVFAIDTKTNSPKPAFISDFPVDMALWREKHITGNWRISARIMQGKFLYTNSTAVEGNNSINAFDYQDGWYDDQGADNRILSWMWRRAPNFFDVVTYKASSISTLLDHNLGVPVEMAWIKSRDSTQAWNILFYDELLSGTFTNNALFSLNSFYTSTATTFKSPVHATNRDYIAYLFASLDGISKVGSYTGNGSSQTIDCGFSSGARFVLIKQASSAGQWYVWDTKRGIVAGNDPWITLNQTNAQNSGYDDIDPHNSGFIVNNTGGAVINQSGESYIFYAIA